MTNYDTLKEYEAHKEPLPSYDEYKRLQEQINEANEVLKDTAHWATDETENQKKAQEYLEKWGVR